VLSSEDERAMYAAWHVSRDVDGHRAYAVRVHLQDDRDSARGPGDRLMEVNELVEQMLEIESGKGRLVGLSSEQLGALRAACHVEADKLLAAARQLLETEPNRETVLAVYDAERSRETSNISDSIDKSEGRLGALGLSSVEFTSAMWDVVLGCAVAGHFGKMDLLADYFASRWGDPADGTHAIDAELNRRRQSVLVSARADAAAPLVAPSAVQSRRSNAAATTGMYLGLASILLSFIGIIPILAVVFGAIGLAKAKDRGGSGRAQAWIGLVLGIVYTFVYLYQYGHLG
jgi:hypothetical protein